MSIIQQRHEDFVDLREVLQGNKFKAARQELEDRFKGSTPGDTEVCGEEGGGGGKRETGGGGLYQGEGAHLWRTTTFGVLHKPPFFRWPNFKAKVRFSFHRNTPPFLGEGFA